LDDKVYNVNGGSEAKYYTEIFPAFERMTSSLVNIYKTSFMK
jgi:hypothetical protein